jgi:DNA-binding NtrC family response regulator
MKIDPCELVRKGLNQFLAELEEEIIRSAVTDAFTVEEAASWLKIPRTTLSSKMIKYGIETNRKYPRGVFHMNSKAKRRHSWKK